jgi:hypothetical protein
MDGHFAIYGDDSDEEDVLMEEGNGEGLMARVVSTTAYLGYSSQYQVTFRLMLENMPREC